MKIKYLFILSLLINLIFGILFYFSKNYEFLIYVFLVIVLSSVILKFVEKKKINSKILMGLLILLILHLSGGYFLINGVRLYDSQIIGFINYDHVVHFIGIFILTLLGYELIKGDFNYKKQNWIFYVLLIFMGMGFGVLNEIIEFVNVLFIELTGVGGYSNTMKDLLANTLGSIVAVIYILLKEKIILRQ